MFSMGEGEVSIGERSSIQEQGMSNADQTQWVKEQFRGCAQGGCGLSASVYRDDAAT